MHIKQIFPGVFALTPRQVADARGVFTETFRHDLFEAHVGPFTFVQDNQSRSAVAGTLRGLHFQRPPTAQGKLVRCLKGSIYDVAVDLRHGAATYGQHVSRTLTAAGGEQLWIPPGFAHGFCTLEADTEIAYKVTAYYSAADDRGLAYDDPDLAIEWPLGGRAPVLSDKDRVQPRLRDLGPYFTI
jgi:dTDP-4-dehydrorhamnose 3,5-epimerase